MQLMSVCNKRQQDYIIASSFYMAALCLSCEVLSAHGFGLILKYFFISSPSCLNPFTLHTHLPPSLGPSFLLPLLEQSQIDDGDEAQLYQSWFKLVLEKNRLARYESELMIL